jgi:hypothetical protein
MSTRGTTPRCSPRRSATTCRRRVRTDRLAVRPLLSQREERRLRRRRECGPLRMPAHAGLPATRWPRTRERAEQDARQADEPGCASFSGERQAVTGARAADRWWCRARTRSTPRGAC